MTLLTHKEVHSIKRKYIGNCQAMRRCEMVSQLKDNQFSHSVICDVYGLLRSYYKWF